MISTQQIREDLTQLKKQKVTIDQEINALQTLLTLREPGHEPSVTPVTRRIRRELSETEAVSQKEGSQQEVAETIGKKDAPSEPLQYAELAREWLESYDKRRLTIRDFRNWLMQRFDESAINKASLGTPIRKMADDGDLIIVKEGKGRAPTIYEVKAPGLNMV